jgi:hypothetical protein
VRNTKNPLPGVVITFLGVTLVLAFVLLQILAVEVVPDGPQGTSQLPQVPAFPTIGLNNPSRLDSPLQQVKIQRVPAGEAPLEIRRAWQGVVLPATIVYAQARGILTGEIYGPRDFYVVEKNAALNLLRQKDSSAADWFASLPQLANERYLLFEAP